MQVEIKTYTVIYHVSVYMYILYLYKHIFIYKICILRASQVALVVKNLPVNAGDIRDAGSILGWEDHWRRAWQPTPAFLPGESHGQRSLAGYRP